MGFASVSPYLEWVIQDTNHGVDHSEIVAEKVKMWIDEIMGSV
jgi:hypothetical protein